jgi:hypothetical protein
MQLIDPQQFTLKSVTIPTSATKEEWFDIHRQILLCKKASSAWIKQSRDYATGKWGVEFVADSEVQIELDLGLTLQDEPPRVNPDDKSIGLVTIEGISQRFSMWSRKVDSEIRTWDKAQLTRALDLLAPIEKKAAEIRGMLA